MQKNLRYGSLIALAMTLGMPLAAVAEPTVIRVEARRSATADEAAARWRAEFPDVVTFPLPGDWVAIGLGPMEREDANARMAELKAERRIPADSFLAAPGEAVALTPADAVPEVAAEPAAELPAPAPPPGHFINIQSFPTRAEADAALAAWRETFPEAALMELPGGAFTVTLGPMEEATAAAWLTAFKSAGTVPRDAFVTTAEPLGSVAVPGSAPDLPPPGEAQMPPLDQVQRALRWAGLYDGAIDGKDGPMTREAIEAQVVQGRLAPDAPTAMSRLIEQREAWRAEMGLSELRDDHTGLSAIAPMDRLEFDRTQRALSIYRPTGDSGAALILFSQPGGQQEMLDLAGLVTALGWVPKPDRQVSDGRITLKGQDATHIGYAEGRVADGRAEGFVLIWPLEDARNQPRIAAEISDSLTRFAPAETDEAAEQTVPDVTLPAGN
ncbi:peptidoglycan-binding protein [Paracoccus sp. Z118]|uniref:peptidoglycan-binding domain-containing protein n=1 Tax=Paracoccus sp. Z118 TaxID=2851017 RepID=UPI001C2BA69D|nr:peptidoglycan-binding domain-containing protein [Paracoccus sp. Z118]MBV0890724.1 peptidoglycan-binding protein [Paracoccus sp. Z118]